MHILTTSQAIDFPRLFFRIMTTDPVVFKLSQDPGFSKYMPKTCCSYHIN